MKRTQKGFTLVELLVVIAILAILATVSVVGYTSFIDRANESNAKAEAHQIKTSITSALVIPDEKYKIATITTGTGENQVITVVTIELVNNEYVVSSNMPANGIDLNAEGVESDFAGLPGVLKIVDSYLVYVPDSGVRNQVIVAATKASK